MTWACLICKITLSGSSLGAQICPGLYTLKTLRGNKEAKRTNFGLFAAQIQEGTEIAVLNPSRGQAHAKIFTSNPLTLRSRSN